MDDFGSACGEQTDSLTEGCVEFFPWTKKHFAAMLSVAQIRALMQNANPADAERNEAHDCLSTFINSLWQGDLSID